MHETIVLLLSLGAGLFLGGIFFGGLFWTVRKGLSSTRPAIWFFGSFILRTGCVLAGFYFVGSGHWKRILSCLLGFVIARQLIKWLIRFPAKTCKATVKEIGHAP